MMFTAEERNLIALYHSGSREETTAVLREALPYIDNSDTRAAVMSAARKIEAMGGGAFAALFESEVDCAG